MSQLFTKLGEDFNSIDGSLIAYTDTTNAAISPRYHYDLRSFHNDDITVPNTILDLQYQNVASMDGTEMIVLDQPRIIEGPSFGARAMSTIDGLKQSLLDTEIMTQLDLFEISTGNEGWPGADPNVTFGKDSAFHYANDIKITLTSGVTKTVTSTFQDNILDGFSNQGSTYNIELTLPSFPAQAAGTHLDLTNSFIDFTSDPGYAAGLTDSIPFSASTHDLSAGGDTYLQINRTSLVNCNLANITGIRFRLKSVGNMVFTAAAMRLIRSDAYTWQTTDIDTKRGTFTKSIPRVGPNGSSTTAPTYIMTQTRPKNTTLVCKFNTGTLSGSNNSSIYLYSRALPVSSINMYVLLNWSATGCTIQFGENDSLVGSVNSYNALTANTDYLLVFQLYDRTITATLYNSFGAFFGTQLHTDFYITGQTPARGFLGFNFIPYNYDSSIDYITTGDVEFGRFESQVLPSLTMVNADTLGAQSSPTIDITEGMLNASGDATVSTSLTMGTPSPPSLSVVRDGSQWQGGLTTITRVPVGNSNYLRIVGDIFPVNIVRGNYRVAFVNAYGSVGYLGYISGLQANQWNHFEIPLNTTLVPDEYDILIQQDGFYADSFFLDNFSVQALTVAWEVSPTAGADWYPFLFAINDYYTAVNFKTNPGNQLKLRAIATSDTAWVARYEDIPHYQQIGHYGTSVPGVNTFSHEIDFTQGTTFTASESKHAIKTGAFSATQGQSVTFPPRHITKLLR